MTDLQLVNIFNGYLCKIPTQDDKTRVNKIKYFTI